MRQHKYQETNPVKNDKKKWARIQKNPLKCTAQQLWTDRTTQIVQKIKRQTTRQDQIFEQANQGNLLITRTSNTDGA